MLSSGGLIGLKLAYIFRPMTLSRLARIPDLIDVWSTSTVIIGTSELEIFLFTPQTSRRVQMLVRLTEVCSSGAVTAHPQYTLREIFINPSQVIMIREDFRLREVNQNGLLKEGLKEEHRFSKLTINRGQSGSEVVVVGAPSAIEELIHRDGPGLLRG